jgi:hypothetical protein
LITSNLRYLVPLTSVAVAVHLVQLNAEEVRNAAVRYSIDPSSASILKRREIHLYVKGTNADVILNHITLEPNVTLKSVRPELDSLPCSYVNQIGEEVECGDIKLKGLAQIELKFEFKPASGLDALRNWSQITLEPGTQSLHFQAKEQQSLGNTVEEIDQSLDFDVKAPAIAVVIGGAAGALLLAALRMIYRLRPGTRTVDWFQEMKEALIAICGGAVIALSLTFLGGLLSDAKWGVQISATSFKGGVIIGLLSYKIGDLLAQKLWKAPRPTR